MTLENYIQKRIETALAAAAKIGQPHDSFDFISVNRTIRTLHPAAYSRFMDCRPLSCPECGATLPLNATSDDYLHCFHVPRIGTCYSIGQLSPKLMHFHKWCYRCD